MRNHHGLCRGVALRVVPDEQQLVLFTGQPAAGLGFWRNALAVRDFDTFATGIVLPMMKGADHTVVDQGTAGKVGAHVRAMRIDHADLAAGSGKGQQTRAEDVQCVQLPITKVCRLPHTVPASTKARGQCSFDVDCCELGHCYCSSCENPRLHARSILTEQAQALIPRMD
ncbi:hypothetical protein D3C77_577300 [compost metagenome]